MKKHKTPQTLIFIRHAESNFNVARPHGRFMQTEAARQKLNNIPDHRMPLSPKGEASLKATGELVRQKFGMIDVAYHSGFTRTKNTLQGVLNAYTPEEQQRIIVRKSQLLRERDAGYTYNMIEKEVDGHFPWLQPYWKHNGPVFARPIGGESIVTVADRLEFFFRCLGEDYPGAKVLACVHGRVIVAVRFILEDWTYEEAEAFMNGPSPNNCGVTVYEYSETEQRLVLKEYNTCPVGNS